MSYIDGLIEDGTDFRVERRDGQWRIAHRKVAFSPCHVLTVTEEYPMWEGTIREDMVGADVSYHH